MNHRAVRRAVSWNTTLKFSRSKRGWIYHPAKAG
jgi:hypothetical protein